MAEAPKNVPDDVEKLLQELGIPVGQAVPPASKPTLEKFSPSQPAPQLVSLDTLRDLCMNLRIELGRRRLPLQDLLRLSSGSVVELEKLTSDTADIYVNDRLVARGELLVIDDHFAIRVTEVIGAGKSEPKQA